MVELYKFGSFLVLIGFVFNFLETWYFGWNQKPQSPAEMVCDYIAIGFFLIGVLIVTYVSVFHKTSTKVDVYCPYGYSYADCPDADCPDCRH
ncbi:hypothetical protein [Anaerospora hongkongensis]|uniref:hypothetical protein n=1 Tax=Anaerospora hongkongensis TaxID=244830 RepID=UPI002FD94879